MLYGYARVSTRGQERDGNSLTDQERKLKEAGCTVIVHDSFTGTKMDRPEFSRLIGMLRPGDRLVVTKLDRFARTAAGGIEVIRGLLDRGVSVHILNMGLIDNTPTGKLIVTVLLGFAEFERDMIVERTSIGKAVAKQNDPNWREGRKAIAFADGEIERYQGLVASGAKTVNECCKELGISRGTWYNRVANAAVSN